MHNLQSDGNVVYAYYEPEPTLKTLIGKSVPLTEIFTREKIAACQKMITEAKHSFFEHSLADVNYIVSLVQDEAYENNNQELSNRLFQPVSNIKGQAEIYGFTLISHICGYMIEYCQEGKKQPMTKRDIFIITMLVAALERAFQERIVDAGGAIEKEFVSIIEHIRNKEQPAAKFSFG